MRRLCAFALVVLLAVFATGCADDATTPEDGEDGSAVETSDDDAADGTEMFPDIVDVEVTRNDDDTADFDVTVSSPYDSPERYADGWRVLDQDDKVLGEHTLGHDHASEQPFTRTQSGVDVPEATTSVTIEGRDQESGYGGETVTIDW